MTEQGNGEAIGYAAAMSELEGILRELEDDSIDVDRLADRVRRASELIQLCRDRIVRTRTEVSDIVAGLERLDDADANPDPS
jgi:exodeoxyribonuclease VII small subunit